MNNASIAVWYETGCLDEIHLADPPYEAGSVIQREYIDVSDPDEGIFVVRDYIGFTEEGAEDGGYRTLFSRTRVVSPESLSTALSVEVRGVEVLRRTPGAGFKCGLDVVAQERLGFTEDDDDLEVGGPMPTHEN